MQVGSIFAHDKASSINGVRALEQHMQVEKTLEKSMAQEFAKHQGHQIRQANVDRPGDTSTDGSQNGDPMYNSNDEHDVHGSFRESQQEMQIPPESERIREEVVKRLNLQREWQERRLVLSDNFLWVTLIGQDIAVDKIPLHEVIGVSRMEDAGSFKTNNNAFVGSSAVIAFNVQTTQSGYNCGRTYSFQVSNSKVYDSTEIHKR
jgi:hypothetical protein